MKSMLKPLLITLGIVSLLPALAQAQPYPKEGKPGHCGKTEAPEHREHPEFGLMPGTPMPPFLHDIDLTEAQRDEIFTILHAEAPAVRERMKAAHKAHEALQALTMSGKYDGSQGQGIGRNRCRQHGCTVAAALAQRIADLRPADAGTAQTGQ